jgi:PIN domain nuclease of toxin-antitoxin system
LKYLLDTQIFLWWSDATLNRLLSQKAFDAVSDANNDLWISVASIWEIQIKVQTGKLSLPASLAALVSTQRQSNNIEPLPIQLPHIYALASLPNLHRDPFDRLIIAQAIHENLTLITSDAKIAHYPVTTLW